MSEGNMKNNHEMHNSKALQSKSEFGYQAASWLKGVCKAIISILGGFYYGLQWQISSNRKNRSCTNTDIRDNKVIISLTSFPARINTVHKTIYTILNQKEVKPDCVELWLAEEQFPNKERDLPQKLLALRSLGLDICWCEDIRSYKKLLPAIQEHPDCVLVTIDDDVYYKRSFLKGLYEQYLLNNANIYCNKATMFTMKDGIYCTRGGGKQFYKDASYLNKLVGVGGVLYPPKSLDSEVLNTQALRSLAPTNDDIWFWFMAIKNGVRVSVIPHNTPKPLEIFEYKKSPKLTEINDSGEQLFWVQFNNLIEAYPEIDEILKNEYASIV